MSIHREHELNAELQELESKLSTLTPIAMPTDLIDSLGQSMDGQLTDYSSEDADFDDLEEQLNQLGNITMSEEMITRMASAMDRWHEELPVEEKLVPFGEAVANVDKISEKQPRKAIWAAAAAVALLGALSALVTPGPDNGELADMSLVEAAQPMELVAVSPPRNAWVVPDSFTHKVINTTESGIVMSEDNTAHRRIHVEYLDAVTVLDDHGREIEIERPGVEVVLLPVVTN